MAILVQEEGPWSEVARESSPIAELHAHGISYLKGSRLHY